MNPYTVLNVPLDADDRTIRQAYLEAVKVDSPETSPDRFREIREAYDSIRTESLRYDYHLKWRKNCGDSPVDAFLLYLNRHRASTKPVPFPEMKSYLRSCAKAVFKNS